MSLKVFTDPSMTKDALPGLHVGEQLLAHFARGGDDEQVIAFRFQEPKNEA